MAMHCYASNYPPVYKAVIAASPQLTTTLKILLICYVDVYSTSIQGLVRILVPDIKSRSPGVTCIGHENTNIGRPPRHPREGGKLKLSQNTKTRQSPEFHCHTGGQEDLGQPGSTGHSRLRLNITLFLS